MEEENLLPEKYSGIPIKDISIHTMKHSIWDNGKNHILIEFKNDKKIGIFLTPICCESLYFTTDDDLHDQSGNCLKKVILKDAVIELPFLDEDGDICAQQDTSFLEIVTDHGSLTFTAHNEHNGYYGGFSITIKEIE